MQLYTLCIFCAIIWVFLVVLPSVIYWCIICSWIWAVHLIVFILIHAFVRCNGCHICLTRFLCSLSRPFSFFFESHMFSDLFVLPTTAFTCCIRFLIHIMHLFFDRFHLLVYHWWNRRILCFYWIFLLLLWWRHIKQAINVKCDIYGCIGGAWN